MRFRLYNRALAASEIQAIYNAGEQGKCGLESGVADQLAGCRWARAAK